MSFTNCPELSLTFWRSMNDVPGRQLAAAAPYLSSPAGRHRRPRRRRCRPPRYRRRRPSVSSLPRRWRPFCRRRPLRRRRYRRRPPARRTDRGTDSCSSRQQRWRWRVAITVGVGDDGGATTTTAIAATATPEDSDVGFHDHRPPAPASPCRRTSSSPTATCRGRPSTRSSPGSTVRAT